MKKNKLHHALRHILLPQNAEVLKNAGPTFCRMTKAILKDQMYRNVFDYVDDIVVASKEKAKQINDLAETFMNRRRAQLKLNLESFRPRIRLGRLEAKTIPSLRQPP
jgi:hypothetical protein